MARTLLSLALLACLGLAILHLVSAQEQNQELEDNKSHNAALQTKPEEQKIRLLREADAKKDNGKAKSNGKGKSKGKGKGKCKGKGKGKCKQRSGSGKGKGKGKTMRKRGKGKGKGKGRSSKGKGRGKGKCKGKGKGKGKCKQRSGRGKGKGKSKGKGSSRNGKKVNGKGKVKSKGKGKKPTGMKPKEKPTGRQACDTEALCQKIKDYIKYSNQLRKLRRINKTCSTMEKKRDKASAGEFTASGTANDDSDNATVQAIADKLKNCTSSAKEKCETKVIPACTNTTLNAKCEVELDAWIKKFGPAKGSCLQANADCCACITAISPAPSADCLNFEPLDKASKEKKKECTGSGTDGSFGHCRKLQMEAAEKGPTAHKEKCKNGGGDMTTAKSSGRRMIFRNNLMKKFIKT